MVLSDVISEMERRKKSKEELLSEYDTSPPSFRHRHDRRSRRSLKIEQMGEDMEDLPDQEGRHIVDRMMRKEFGKVTLRGTVVEYVRPDSPEEPEGWIVEYDD